jgi:hypothetical protein
MKIQEVANTLSAADWTSIVSAGAAAIAAFISLITILITINGNKKKEKEKERKTTYMLLSHLIEVKLAFDDAIRSPTDKLINRVNNSVTELLKALALNGVMQKHERLPITCEMCLIFVAELQFTDFKSGEIISELSKFEMKFRKAKFSIEKDLGIKPNLSLSTVV